MSKNTKVEKYSIDIGSNDLDGTDMDSLQLALKSGMTRREAMFMMAAAGISIAAADSIITTAKAVTNAVPTKGGSLRFATNLHGPGDTLDPALATGDIDYSRGRCLYNSLIQINDDLSTKPELAEEYSANSDNTEWTFKLRKGVKFHDGSLMTADDVLYSLRRHHGEKSISKAKTLVSDVVEWKKIDRHTIKAILSGPNADLPVILGTPHFKIIKDGTTDFQNPVGTGPFKKKDNPNTSPPKHKSV
jgi:peptide/nickel transport system substrate-binding protein